MEERIVLFRARSWEEAEKKALKEAQVYADRNIQYGKQPRWGRKRVIDACHVYVVPGDPHAGQEVFWSSTYHKRKVPIAEILDSKFDGDRMSLAERPEWALRHDS